MAPTRELVQQIAGEAKKLAPVVSARVLGIFGGVGKGAQGVCLCRLFGENMLKEIRR